MNNFLRIGILIWTISLLLKQVMLQMNRQIRINLVSKLILFPISPIIVVLNYSSLSPKFITENLKTALTFWRIVSFFVIFSALFLLVTLIFQNLLKLPDEFLQITLLLTPLAPTILFLIGTFYYPEMVLIETEELFRVSRIYSLLSANDQRDNKARSDDIINYLDYIEQEYFRIEIDR